MNTTIMCTSCSIRDILGAAKLYLKFRNLLLSRDILGKYIHIHW